MKKKLKFLTRTPVLLPLLRPKRDFRRIAYFDECGIDFYWCSEEKTIFLVPKSTNDFATLINLAERMNAAPNELTSHDIIKGKCGSFSIEIHSLIKLSRFLEFF